MDFGGVFGAGCFDAAGDVDAGGREDADGFTDIVGGEAAGDEVGGGQGGGEVPGLPPVEGGAGAAGLPGNEGVEEDVFCQVGGGRGGGVEAVSHGHGLDDRPADRPAVGGGFAAVELDVVEAAAAGGVLDDGEGLVDEDADATDAADLAGDAGGGGDAYPPPAGGEDEADEVGTGVVGGAGGFDGGYAADFYDNGNPSL
jgi:hypothetical protein